MSSYTPDTIHLLDHGASDPAWNMAVDDALLDARNAGRIDGTWIRLFAWDPPAITLGRLQEPGDELDPERIGRDAVRVVRRATGGKAVYHACELTYSVIGGLEDSRWGDTLHATYRAVTDLVADGLGRLGIDTALAPGRPSAARLAGDDLKAACFAVAFGHELTHAGRKICGSAQRRLVRAFLQHGSLLLGPEHARLAEWLRTDRDRAALRRRLERDTVAVGDALGRPIEYAEVSLAIRQAIENRHGERVRAAELPREIADDARGRLAAVEVTPANPGTSDTLERVTR
jgi:lipoate-protein ligase A